LCAFCHDPGDRREHVIPEWLSKRLSIKAEIPADVAFRVPGPRRRKQGISFGGYRASVMCKGCNEHFGKLEEAVIPLLEPMARGVTVVLDQESQQLLALWATKTAIALLSAEDPATVPKEQGRMVRDKARCPEGVWVGFFPWRGDPVLWTSTGSNADSTRRLVEMFGALLAFGAVGFFVAAIKEPSSVPYALTGERPPLRQFWSLRHRMIEWPPGPPLDSTSLPGLREFVRKAVDDG
jgi:hypothetical protein